MDTFTEAFIEAILWSSVIDHDNEIYGDQVDADLAPETLERIKTDCAQFQDQFGALMEGLDPSQCGHDFALTRNHHGAGFWDRGYGPLGDELTAAAHQFGELDLYLGDDGQIYC